jgi:hypothetical protein
MQEEIELRKECKVCGALNHKEEDCRECNRLPSESE